MDPFIAQIVMFGGNFAPRGWALCDGQLLSISSYSALFSILGTTYGGDGRTTFGLPDLRGRMAVHEGSGPGLPPVSLGEKGGNPTTTLNVQNLPSHSHGLVIKATTANATEDDPDGHLLGANINAYSTGAADADMNSAMATVANTGNNTSFSNISPFTAVNFIIALVGTYPSRN